MGQFASCRCCMTEDPEDRNAFTGCCGCVGAGGYDSVGKWWAAARSAHLIWAGKNNPMLSKYDKMDYNLVRERKKKIINQLSIGKSRRFVTQNHLERSHKKLWTRGGGRWTNFSQSDRQEEIITTSRFQLLNHTPNWPERRALTSFPSRKIFSVFVALR